MASSINASTSGAGGVITTADNSGILNLQSNGTTVATVSSTGFSTPANQTINTANTFGFKNRIINGGMTIDQRNAGASVSISSSVQYRLDRWNTYCPTGSGNTVQQVVDAPSGFYYSQKVTIGTGASPSSGDQNQIFQQIEGYNVADFNLGSSSALTFTCSFWVKSSLTGTFNISFQNSLSNRSYVTTYTINSANTWEQKTVTLTGDITGTWNKTNSTGLTVNFSLGCGSSFNTTANTWTGSDVKSTSGATNVVATSGATFYITGVQLEVGSQATSFDFRDYGRELILCQRYFEKSYDYSVAVGTGSNLGRFEVTASSNAGGDQVLNIKYAVAKRTAPTMTAYTAGAGTSGQWRRASSVSGASDATLNWEFQSTNGCGAYIAQGGGLVVCSCEGQWTASAEL